MYNTYDSDIYFFTREVSFLLENKDRDALISLTLKKHKEECKENLSISTKKNDLIVWNVIFARKIIKNGTSKQYIHTLYNKFYKIIQSASNLAILQKIELDLINSYLDILINYIELKDNLIVNKIIGYLYLQIENKISLDDIAKNLNISVGYMSNIFKENTHISIMRYLKYIKIERAKVLLATTNKTILDISTLLCFCDQSNFTKTFKSLVGLTPSQYKNNTSLK